MLAPRGVHMNGMPKSHFVTDNTIPKAVAALDACKQAYADQQQATTETLEESARALAAMDNQEHALIIEQRHIYGMTAGQIGNLLGYGKPWVHARAHIGLRELYDTMPGEWRIPLHRAV